MREVALAAGGLQGARAVIDAFRDSYISRDSDDDIDAAAYNAMVDALARRMIIASAVATVVLHDSPMDTRLRDAAASLAGDLAQVVGLAARADETYAMLVPQEARDELHRLASQVDRARNGRP